MTSLEGGLDIKWKNSATSDVSNLYLNPFERNSIDKNCLD
jgi:hypothetical protein